MPSTTSRSLFSLPSLGDSHNTFVAETLVDDLAMSANADPIANRLQLRISFASAVERGRSGMVTHRSSQRESPQLET